MLFKPHFQFNNICDITLDFLKEIGVDTLVLDVDNTLCIQKGKVVLPNVMQWLDDMKKSGIKLIILSNAKPKRMLPIAKNFGLEFVPLGLKPLPFGYWCAAKKIGGKNKNCAIVGDQLLTDILGGHLANQKTILVSPAELETSFGFKIKRGIERKLLKLYKMKCDF